MRPLTIRRIAGVLLLTLAWCGCQGSGARRLAPTETREPNGFSITETESVGFRVRSNFEEANQAIEGGNLTRGIELLEGVTETAPHFAAAHINLAIAYQRSGDLANAEAALLKALTANPRHPVAQNELGIVYRKTGRFENARESFEAALELHPNFHFARKNLAVLCDLYLSDLQCALANYRIYKEADPQDESVGIWIADLESRLGQEGD